MRLEQRDHRNKDESATHADQRADSSDEYPEAEHRRIEQHRSRDFVACYP
jgi:hypothetical protein